MIIFDLTCNSDHRFEGWFQSQENFDRQLEEGLISCPVCGSIDIRRVPSAVHLGKPVSTPEHTQSQNHSKNHSQNLQMMTPHGEVLAAYQKLLSAIVSSCEDVGKAFADEARKIHYGESDKRGIYGETSDEEAEALAEEGIEFGRLPWIPRGN